MPLSLNLSLVVLSVLGSGLFATLTYSLRDFSRPKLADLLSRRQLQRLFDTTVDHAGELAFLTATFRLILNMTVLLELLELTRNRHWEHWVEYAVAAAATIAITILTSVTIPHALAAHVAEPVIAVAVRPLNWLRIVCRPLAAMLNATETVVKRAATATETKSATANEDIQSEILAVVQEGEKEGIVDEAEREMIRSVITFGDTTAGQVMTARPAIVALAADAPLEKVRTTIDESGHSRIPLYEGTLDQVVGVLYARDLIKLVGQPGESFSARVMARPAFFVPNTKPLSDLLSDFRLQKIHIAIVLDEYGGTSGLVTIEDVLEELVGDISDEHEPAVAATFRRLDDQTAEADASIHVEEFNRLFGTTLPENAGYDTLGGFVSTHLGVIPPKDTEFDHEGVHYVIADAEPQRVTRVKAQMASEK